jgi:hypothetical protein
MSRGGDDEIGNVKGGDDEIGNVKGVYYNY